MVLTDLIWTHVPGIDIVSIDTGRLPEETLALLERLERRYQRRIKLYYPDAQAVQNYVREHGINGFYNSLGERISCCQIRKIEPFNRAVAGYRAWVTGVRREQSTLRAEAQAVSPDEQTGLQKISPLLEWSSADIWTYIRAHQLYYSPLHDRGYPSIGCAPCTRAIEPGEDASRRSLVVGEPGLARMRPASPAATGRRQPGAALERGSAAAAHAGGVAAAVNGRLIR